MGQLFARASIELTPTHWVATNIRTEAPKNAKYAHYVRILTEHAHLYPHTYICIYAFGDYVMRVREWYWSHRANGLR